MDSLESTLPIIAREKIYNLGQTEEPALHNLSGKECGGDSRGLAGAHWSQCQRDN